MTTTRRPTLPRSARAYCDSDTREILVRREARAQAVKAMSTEELTREAAALREALVADSSVALDAEWSWNANLVSTELRAR